MYTVSLSIDEKRYTILEDCSYICWKCIYWLLHSGENHCYINSCRHTDITEDESDLIWHINYLSREYSSILFHCAQYDDSSLFLLHLSGSCWESLGPSSQPVARRFGEKEIWHIRLRPNKKWRNEELRERLKKEKICKRLHLTYLAFNFFHTGDRTAAVAVHLSILLSVSFCFFSECHILIWCALISLIYQRFVFSCIYCTRL